MMHHPSPQFLQRVLKWNSGFSLLSGLALVFAATPLAALMAPQLGAVLGLSFPMFLRLIGLAVIGFAALVWRVAASRALPRWQVWLIVSLDIDWVLGSGTVLLFAGNHFTVMGKLLIADIALVVAVFAGLALFGLLRAPMPGLRPEPEPASSTS